MLTIAEPRLFTIKKPFNRARTYRAIKTLADTLISSAKKIDQILYVFDPEAPGGVYVAAELFRIISRVAPIKHPLDYLEIEGRRGMARQTGRIPSVTEDVKTILLVDDTALSGRTLKVAKDALRKKYPEITVLTAVVAVGEATSPKPDHYAYAVSEREVLFPWGNVDSTGEYRTPYKTAFLPDAIKFGYRVWGYYEEFALNTPCTCRVLTVQRNQRLSLQVHFQRDELFFVLDPNTSFEVAKIWRGHHQFTLQELEEAVTLSDRGGKQLILSDGLELQRTTYHPKAGFYVLIPRGVFHRLVATKNLIRVMEVSFGFYDQDQDIARLEDDYGRAGLPGRF